MGYLDLAKKIEVRLLDEGKYSSNVQSAIGRPTICKSDCSIKVIDYSGSEPIEIPLTIIFHQTIRYVLRPSSDLLIEFKTASGAILAATGDNSLRLAQRLQPDRAIPFHDIINFLLPHWDSAMMDKRLVDVLPSPMFKRPLEDIVEVAKQIFNAEVVA